MLKLSWKFGESKWNPCWVIVLTSSSGTNHVPNEYEDIDQYGSFALPSDLMLYWKPSWKFGESKWFPYWVVSTSFPALIANYVPKEHEGVDQYGSFSIPSKLVLSQSHPESLVNQNEILIELSC